MRENMRCREQDPRRNVYPRKFNRLTKGRDSQEEKSFVGFSQSQRRFSQPRKRTCPGFLSPASLELGGKERGRLRNLATLGQEIGPDHPEPCGGLESREGTRKPHPQSALAGWKH
eukprot:15583882-Heterocapsa_arctica.AAC.1